MPRKNKAREVELKELAKDNEYELWESKYLIGRISKKDSKYEYVLNGNDSAKTSKDLDEAINELLLQYNLHTH